MGPVRKGRITMKAEKLKRYQVTQTLRFPSNIMKIFFYGGLVLLPLSALVIVLGIFVDALAGVRGLCIILMVLSAIWLFSARSISESNFGMANVSFTDSCIIFRTGGENNTEHSMRWDDAVCAGMIKTRWAWWCYVSDHELAEKERKEFPEFVEKGVYYFCYADNTWEELMRFVPDRLRIELKSAKKAAGLGDDDAYEAE